MPQQPPTPPEDDALCHDPMSMPAAADSRDEVAHDWTADLPQTDHVRFFRQVDWVNSKLGPLDQWGDTLRVFIRLLFADTRAACIWWGPHLVAIYNEAYASLSAHAHPRLMGTAFPEGYPDLWQGIKPYFDKARETGVGVEYSPAQALIVQRAGYREE